MRVNDLEIPGERDFPPGRQERRARHLVRELTAARRRRRLALTLVAAVIVLLTAATGFTAYTLLREEPSHFESIGCFERADLRANVSVVSPDGRSAVEQCRDIWDEGVVGRPVPAKLAACVLSTGPVGVFPSVDDRTCERMGLADLSAQGQAEGRRFVRMRNAVYAEIGTPPSGSSRGSSHCVGEERAHVIVRRVLDAHGYSDWTVRSVGEGFSGERPCADVSFDGGGKEALLMSGGRN
jgi:hypothetical protein